MNNKYHIDVTPEEDALFKDEPEISKSNWNKKMNFKFFKNSIFWIVFGVHIAVISAIALAAKPNFKDPVPEMAGIDEDQAYVEANTPKAASQPTPKPTPIPQKTDEAPMDGKPTDLIKPSKPVVKSDPHFTQSKNHFTTEYTIKNGDTVFSIAKKYKLNYDRLIKINNIKDPNKITVGQKLKFM